MKVVLPLEWYDVRTFPQKGDFTGRKWCVKDLCDSLGQFVGNFFIIQGEMLSGSMALFLFTCRSFLQTTWECTIGTSLADGKNDRRHDISSGWISAATVAKYWFKDSASSPSNSAMPSLLRVKQDCLLVLPDITLTVCNLLLLIFAIYIKSVYEKFFDSDFPSPCFDVPKASNLTSGGVQNRDTKNRRLRTIVTSIQDSKPREKQISQSFSYCELINLLRNGTIVRCLWENKKK